MAVYTIIRVYEVPADTQQQATDRMIEALALARGAGFPREGCHPGAWRKTRPGQAG